MLEKLDNPVVATESDTERTATSSHSSTSGETVSVCEAEIAVGMMTEVGNTSARIQHTKSAGSYNTQMAHTVCQAKRNTSGLSEHDRWPTRASRSFTKGPTC